MEMKQYLERQRRGTEDFPFAYYKEKYENHMIRLHWHPEIELLYGISGELTVTVSEEKYILKAGDIFFINPEELHSYSPHSKEVQYHATVFAPTLFQFKEQHFFEQHFTNPLVDGEMKFPRLITNEHPKYEVIAPIVHKLFNQDIQSKAMVFADLTLLFCTLLEHSMLETVMGDTVLKKSEDVKLCIQYMEENYGRKITLTELADLVHMTPNYFCNYFKKQTGLTPFTQLNSIRVRRASKMLRNTETSIAEIAEACGYENVSFFIRKFKEIRGCTPSVYRKKG
ncbi:MAG: AraC family transcriptional regulator [Tyzzerella sp.]|nr:AraC family transcriptional regulator [Tyzzerella sp.]